MKLYLVQHGEAVSKEADRERPLSVQGVGEIERLARFIEGKVNPARVLHSGKARARQTAEILASALYVDEIAQQPGLTPNAAIDSFVEAIRSGGDDLLVASHQPFLGKLVSTLLIGNADIAVVDFLPGTLACLEQTETGAWILQCVVRPEMLR